MNKKKGFTLIELMIVVAIITILSSITAPKFGKQIQKAKDARVLTVLSAFRSGVTIYQTDDPDFEPPSTISDIVTYLSNNVKSEMASGIETGNVTSLQFKAGTVKKDDGTESVGRGDFSGEKNIAELYYDSTVGELYIDGTTGSGIDFKDTKGKKWNEY